MAMTTLAVAHPREDARALIERAVRREAHAVDELVDRLMPVVHARVFRVLKRTQRAVDRVVVEDFAQEVWVSLFADGGKRLLAYDPARGASLETFVGLLAEHEAGEVARAQRAQKRGGHLRAVDLDAAAEMPSKSPGPAEQAEAKELAARLGEHLVGQLPEVGRLVYRYAFKDEVEAPAVARIVGVDVQVVYNWQHKIRRLARAFLATI